MALAEMGSAEPPRFLVLLPPATLPVKAASIKSAYAETLTQVLKEVATHSGEHSRAAVLEIALSCPHLAGAQGKPRASLFDQTQSLVAALYKLVCVIAAQENINVEDADGVDARVLLVAWSPDAQLHPTKPIPYSIIVDLKTLATCGRAWQYAFGVESEAGEAMVKAFVDAKGATGAVGGDSTANVPQSKGLSANDEESNSTASQLHLHVAVGGTFDHLHIGHKLLLTMTIFAVDDGPRNEERSATIGITGDQLLIKKKHADFLESWTERQRAVAAFVNSIMDFSSPVTPGQRHASVRDDPGPNGKSIDIHYPSGLVVKCTEIQDPYGPTITEECISALVISAETRAGGRAVNDKRKEKLWAELEVFEVDVLDAESEGAAKEGFESKLSSTAIRQKLAAKR